MEIDENGSRESTIIGAAVLEETFREAFLPAFGSLNRLPNTPHLGLDDPRLDRFARVGLDVEAIHRWANPGDPMFRRNRQQLLDTFPILVPVLAISGISETPCLHEVSAAIDRANPLIDLLSRLLNIGKGTLRYLMGLSPVTVGAAWVGNPIQLFWAVRIVPEAYRPETPDEWVIFHDYWQLSDLHSDYGYESTPNISTRNYLKEHVFIRLCRNRYSRRAKQRLDQMTDGQQNNVLLARDYFEFVASVCSDRWPEIRWSSYPGPTLADSLLMRYPLADLVRQSMLWHQEIQRQFDTCLANERKRSDSSLGTWPPLLQEPLDHRELQAVSLVCASDLAQEGARLEHCVRQYIPACMAGQSHIVSIRDLSGNSMSTAEIALAEAGMDRWMATCRQHYAIGNTPPSFECEEMLDLLLAKLSLDESQPWLRQLQKIHDDRREELEYHLYDARQESLRFNEAMLQQILPDFERAMKWLDREARRRQGA